ncbi:GNAT family N-acetyltransferase [Photobacterium makurazakiensis]|uniref:tRNA(Met) cytidine acetyltransferase TmcA n=1 Tax=Photobacterium makurazakiensis TaxID=2910234 RepID=UPI003D131E68
MSPIHHYCSQLIHQATTANIRYLVIAQGNQEWGIELSRHFASLLPNSLVCGGEAIDQIPFIPTKKAKQKLGQECQCLIFNMHNGFDAEAFGALSGTIIGGGILLLMVGDEFNATQCSAFRNRLSKLFSDKNVVYLKQNEDLPTLPALPKQSLIEFSGDNYGSLTACQSAAITAVRRVVTGHRKRPVVITADRGRGKSAAMGLAAASLLEERNIRIVVTAPSYGCAETLFRHVVARFNVPFTKQNHLALGSGQITFVSPDQLLANDIVADFVIVDEAAAIPAPLLSAMLSRFNRIVFSSTVHGYEGTGRGFAIKFRQLLDSKMPQWRSIELNQPIRWADNDPLEDWTFKALLFDADLIELDEKFCCNVEQELAFKLVDKQLLISCEPLLKQIFSLLVNAHYQTSPADLVNILDDEALSIIAAFHGEIVVGCCIVVAEGGLDGVLVEQVQLGTRRIKGHLLAQSVAAHLGIKQGATQRCGRIMRIAVHPQLQQQGIGVSLLQYTAAWAKDNFDYLGTSFGYVPELFLFWLKAGYQPVRLGIKKDASSGYQSLQCILALNAQSKVWAEIAENLFAVNFHYNANECFGVLPTTFFMPLYQLVARDLDTQLSLPESVWSQQLSLYCQGGLGYELALPSLTLALMRYLKTATVKPDPMIHLVVAKVIQRKSWCDISEEFNLSSHKEAEQHLRQWFFKHF